MQKLPLKWINGHLFATIDKDDWLIDTGAPSSFGDVKLILQNKAFDCPEEYMSLNAATLSEFVDHDTVGIIGMDVIKGFDILFDIPNSEIIFSPGFLNLSARNIEIDQFMDIPIVTVSIDGTTYRMFFDTGAQISYFQNESLANHPTGGILTDFYPGFGRFQTETYYIETVLGEECHTLQYGALPDLLAMSLMMANTQGIIGNKILENRTVGFSPRQRKLDLSINSHTELA